MSLRFGGAKYLSLACRGSGQTLHRKSERLQPPAYDSLGAIGCQHGIRIHCLNYAAQGIVAPHLRLFFGREGIKIYHVDSLREPGGQEIGFALFKRKRRRDFYRLIPRASFRRDSISTP